MKKILLILFLSFGIMKEIKAQCGTKTPKKDPLEGKILQNSVSTASFRFKIFVTIFRNTDGSNPACTEAQILTKIAEMNTDFGSTSCFNLMGIKYRDNTHLNTNMDTEDTDDINALTNYNEAGCIDIYVHKSGLRAGTLPIGGTSYDIPNQFLSIDQLDNHTLSHEMGHCLGLFHTHETAFGAERVDGSDCGAEGDKVCDTAADPSYNRTCRTQSTCGYTGTCTDEAAQTYSPPTNNIMSYYGCVTTFTSGQFTRIFNTVIVNITLFAANLIATGNDHYPSSPIFSTLISSGIETYATAGSIQLGWGNNSIGTYEVTNTGILYAQANQVKLSPGFKAKAGTVGKVRIKSLTCN